MLKLHAVLYNWKPKLLATVGYGNSQKMKNIKKKK